MSQRKAVTSRKAAMYLTSSKAGEGKNLDEHAELTGWNRGYCREAIRATWPRRCREFVGGLSQSGPLPGRGCSCESGRVEAGPGGPGGVVQAAVRYSLMSPLHAVSRSIGWPDLNDIAGVVG